MTRQRDVLFVDIESYWNFFYIGFKRARDGKRVGLELSERSSDFDREFVRKMFLTHETVGYNSFSYDLPLIWLSLREETTYEDLKRATDRVILGRLKPWEVEDALGISIPYEVRQNHIDLMEPQPNAFASLKALNGRMHGARLQDLPYEPGRILSHSEMEEVADYCLTSDLDATHLLFTTLEEPLALRRALGEQNKMNFMSKSDSQIGEAIVKKRVESITKRRAPRPKINAGSTFRYPIPDWMRFETPMLQDVLERIRTTDFRIDSKGKVALPSWLDGLTLTIGNSTYAMGIGGLHSTESNRSVKSTDDFILVDADVASQYPSIILMLGLFPQALGPEFLTAYKAIKDERIAAKKRAKAIKAELPGVNDPDRIAALKHELTICQVKDKGGKIQLNGVYGKLGSPYSALYAPHLMISVTLTGQLTLLMLIERAEKAGISVVSGNTDGVLFRCPRKLYGGLDGDRLKPSVLESICSEWERLTSFDLEFGEYSAVYNASVNTYYALKPDGGHKRKGPVGNPWSKDPSDFDPVRGQLMKNPQATIVSDAVLAKLKDGTALEDTIRASRDIRDFVTVIKASKGATWKGRYLGKTVRFYWAIGGEAIYDAEPNETGTFKQIPKSEGARECMNLPSALPHDIDYDRYIAEAESLLNDVGYYGSKVQERKVPRVTNENYQRLLNFARL